MLTKQTNMKKGLYPTIPRHIRRWAEKSFDRTPPEIVIKGWWWKRFIPKYRKQKFFMNWLLEKEWKEGLGKKIRKKMSKC